jgi:hypothetical protein
MTLKLAALFLVYPMVSFSQNAIKYHDKNLSFSSGVTLPIEEFGGSVSEENFPATTGLNLKLELLYQVMNKVFAGASFHYISNPLSKKTFVPLFLSDKRSLNYENNPNESWKNYLLLIGPCYQLNLHNFRIDLKIKSGIVWSKEPTLTRVFTSYYNKHGQPIDPILDKPFIYQSQTEYITTPSRESISKVFSTGTTIYLKLAKRISIFLDNEVMFANIKSGSHIKEISVWNINMGATYNFIQIPTQLNKHHPRFRK